MKRPYIIKFYLYAESEEEVERAQKAAHDFVRAQYDRGRIVTADRLAEALRKAQGNSLIANILTE